MDDSLLENHGSDGHGESKFDDLPDMLNDLERLSDYDNVNGFLSYTGSNATSDAQQSIFDFEDAQDQVFSPPLLMDSSLLADPFEDLLGMLCLQQTVLVIVICLSVLFYHLLVKCFASLKYDAGWGVFFFSLTGLLKMLKEYFGIDLIKYLRCRP